MKFSVFLVGTLLLCASNAWAARYYVSAGGTGHGQSWASPLGQLQEALRMAKSGDEVWVTNGIYTPSSSHDRSASFHIPPGVSVFGGFKGHESHLDQRNWQQNHTVLSGDLGALGDGSDNSFTIVYFSRASSSTVLDGFTIAHGTAKAFIRGADPKVVGAAIFNDGSLGPSSPTIRNCIFEQNRAREGAAIYNYAAGGECTPQILNCTFKNNWADFNGGAIFNHANKSKCTPKISGCTFIDNRAVYGGGIYNQAESGDCLPQLESSSFANNFSSMSGSVLYNKLKSGSRVYTTIKACQLENNQSAAGSDIDNNSAFVAQAIGLRID
ncbi:MAG: hypothetical protein AAF741_03135 [Bacteroidota bacterium]